MEGRRRLPRLLSKKVTDSRRGFLHGYYYFGGAGGGSSQAWTVL